MLRFFIQIAIFTFSQIVLAQSLGYQPAELPPGSVKMEAGTPDNAANRLLIHFYRNVGYPSRARNYGVEGAVQLMINVDSVGILTVDTARFISIAELDERPLKIREDDLFTVTGYSVGGNSLKRPATKNIRARAKGERTLIDEAIRVFEICPTFTPAKQDGKPVASKMVKTVMFRLE